MKNNYFENLKNKLPCLKCIEGFPRSRDSVILAMSDPPYYTACPNPFIDGILEKWEKEKASIHNRKEKSGETGRKFYVGDVSGGKNDPVYNGHPYHTKVPPGVIMRHILNNTEPGDIVMDGFCGAGMTGVAAQLCGSREAVEEQGYRVDEEGTILARENASASWKPFSQMGPRRALLNDLSPAATFIAYNYNASLNVSEFNDCAGQLLEEVELNYGWMYETIHETDGRVQSDKNGHPIMGRINFTLWSDVFLCPRCSGDLVYWETAVDRDKGEAREEIQCPHCGEITNRRYLKRAGVMKYDPFLKKEIEVARQVPVMINYTVKEKHPKSGRMRKRRYEKKPDAFDLNTMKRIEKMEPPSPFPVNPVPPGQNTLQPAKSHGITHAHHFYTARNRIILGILFQKIREMDPRYLFWFTSALTWTGRENRLHLGNYFFGGGGVISSFRGTWYVASLSVETNVIQRFRLRMRGMKFRNNKALRKDGVVIRTGSLTCCDEIQRDESIDYIFTDPPFGANLMYSELNFLWESWLGIFTDNGPEAIINRIQNKDVPEYLQLMKKCFNEYFRLLKPGRFMTVVFHNSNGDVWRAIQNAILDSGFIISHVSVMDKKKGSFKQVTTAIAPKRDLVISAYKPTKKAGKKTLLREASLDSVWEFVEKRLSELPLFDKKEGKTGIFEERTPSSLYDRAAAYFVEKGYGVPISSREFQTQLKKKYPQKNGMTFLPEQM